MIPIKIQCGCGQRYAFDIEPVGNQMPTAVACPTCGADGTAAANDYIAQIVPAPAPTVRASAAPLRISLAAHSTSPSAAPAPAAPESEPVHTYAPPPPRRGLLPGQIDKAQAVHEAKAKISWGDAPEEVTKFLMIQGYSHAEASELVKEMFQERAATIRGNGVRKILIGIGLVCVPIVSLLIFLSLGFIPLKIFAITILIGLYGLWLILKGIFMVVSPRSEAGDVAEQ
jgi:hypothetical protein